MKQYQITGDDLAELERVIPELADAMLPVLNNPVRVKLRRVQAILSNVRWNYGPPTEVKVIPADGEPEQ